MAHAIPPDPGQQAVEALRLNTDLEPAKDEDRRLRQDSAVALRIAGANYSEIAQALDYPDARSARLAVERALASTIGDEDRDKARALEGRRLERVLRGLWGKATDEAHPEHLPAARTALAVIDRHAKLYGLDAPTEHIIYNPAGEEIAAWVQSLVATTRDELPSEADVLDVEWEEVEDAS